jgi:transposase
LPSLVEALKPKPPSVKRAKAKRKPPGETIDEQRLAMLEEAGMSIENIAKKHGRRIDVIERSLRRARQRNS